MHRNGRAQYMYNPSPLKPDDCRSQPCQTMNCPPPNDEMLIHVRRHDKNIKKFSNQIWQVSHLGTHCALFIPAMVALIVFFLLGLVGFALLVLSISSSRLFPCCCFHVHGRHSSGCFRFRGASTSGFFFFDPRQHSEIQERPRRPLISLSHSAFLSQ